MSFQNSHSSDHDSNGIQQVHASANTLTIRYPPVPRPFIPDPSSLNNVLRMAVMENYSSNLYSGSHNDHDNDGNHPSNNSEDLQEISIYRIEYYVMGGFASFLSRWQAARGYGSFSFTAYEDIFGPKVKLDKQPSEYFGAHSAITDSSMNIYSPIELSRLPKYYNTIFPNKYLSSDKSLRNVVKEENITLSTVYTINDLNPSTKYGLRVIPGIISTTTGHNANPSITWFDPYPVAIGFKTLTINEEENRLAIIQQKREKLSISHDQYLTRSMNYHQQQSGNFMKQETNSSSNYSTKSNHTALLDMTIDFDN